MKQNEIDPIKNSPDNRKDLNTLWLTLNRRCNLRCKWCYALMTKYENRDMAIETVIKYVELAAELGADSGVMIGGEPTLHPDFFEVIRIIKSKGLRPCLVTNGMRFADKEFLKKTINAGLASITLSFKAPNRKIFFEDTGKDQFDEQVKAVQNIIESGISYTISVTACESLMDNFDEMMQTVKNMGADNILIDTGKPVLLNGETIADGMKTPKEVAKFIMEAYPKLHKSGLRFSFKLALPFCLFPREFIEKMLGDEKMTTACQMMKISFWAVWVKIFQTQKNSAIS